MNKFTFNPFDKQLSQLKTNKAIGSDRISARLPKDSASVIADSLTVLFNRSLDSQAISLRFGSVVKCLRCLNLAIDVILIITDQFYSTDDQQNP